MASSTAVARRIGADDIPLITRAADVGGRVRAGQGTPFDLSGC